jgi:hypothetical protein
VPYLNCVAIAQIEADGIIGGTPKPVMAKGPGRFRKSTSQEILVCSSVAVHL